MRDKKEVYNRYFWHILFIQNCKINKKAYPQTLKFLPIPQTFPMTPFILKIDHVKKAYIQILDISMTSFILKIKNGYLQTPNIPITPIHIKK